MFLCHECLEKMCLEDILWLLRSRGPCEDCRKVAICTDYPTRLMPIRKPTKATR